MFQAKQYDHHIQLRIAAHAIKQAQRRGVSVESIPLAAKYGRVCRLPGSYSIRLLDRRIIASLLHAGVTLPIGTDRLVGTVVLTQDSGTTRVVITTLPKEKARGLREVHRRAKAIARKHNLLHGYWESIEASTLRKAA